MRSRKILITLSSIIVLAAVILNAWIDEDAFISFRAISNFVAGYGLRFNISERVQAFTHPLWLAVSTLFHLITGEFLLSSFLASSVCTLATVFLVFSRSYTSVAQIISLTLLLIFSRSFIHYSTSGLENSLSHLLAVAFLLIWTKSNQSVERKAFFLSLLSALAAVNRLDSILLSVPAMISFFAIHRTKSVFFRILAGGIPLVAWLIFSLCYYGQLFPNTYYAKLNTDIAKIELYKAGIFYLEHSLVRDPTTLITIIGACIVALATRSMLFISLSVGIILYLLYIISIGGDYMCGRFLSTPFIVAVFILATAVSHSKLLPLTAAICVVLSFIAGNVPILTNLHSHKGAFSASPEPYDTLVVDKQHYFYQTQGLPFLLANKFLPAKREQGEHRVSFVLALNQATMRSPYKEHIVDDVGLADPILSRLPSRGYWRPGHFVRDIPLGYPGLLRGTMEHLCDPNLEQFRQHVNLITRGDIWSIQRFESIFSMTIGAYNHLIDKTYYKNPLRMVPLEDVAGQSDVNSCAGMMGSKGLKISLPSLSHATGIHLQAIEGERYKMYFLNAGVDKGSVEFGQRSCSGVCDQLVPLDFEVPDAVRVSGFDTVWIVPLARGVFGVQKVADVRLLNG